MRRHDGAEPWAIDLSWRAQRRLHGRWQRLRADRNKHNGIAAIAVARELTHFVWELASPTDTPPAGCRGAATPEPVAPSRSRLSCEQSHRGAALDLRQPNAATHNGLEVASPRISA